jgi:hypothetical protein
MPKKSIIVFAVLALFLSTNSAMASHSWGSYHWARTANPFTLKLGDNVSSLWDSYLATTSTDWTASTVLDTIIIPGLRGKTCKATLGRAEVCNKTYGKNGWLGIASIWANGSHITQGTVKMNNTYFNTAQYNTPAWKNLVMCQEVGHIFGLDHQDETFNNANLGTCMDYTNSPASNQHPNAHDYEMLETIYSHLDSATTLSQTTYSANGKNEIGDAQSDWGKAIKKDGKGRDSVFEKDLGGGNKVLTHVFWVE